MINLQEILKNNTEDSIDSIIDNLDILGKIELLDKIKKFEELNNYNKLFDVFTNTNKNYLKQAFIENNSDELKKGAIKLSDFDFSIGSYKKHKEYFDAGCINKIRLILGGNRVGKTETGTLYELACHAINWYPDWWQGKKFNKKDLTVLLATDSRKSCRDNLQAKLIGPTIEQFGLGLIPKSNFVEMPKRLQGVQNSVDYFKVKRNGGGTTTIYFKTYEQDRKDYQGINADIVIFDEEPPDDIYEEGLLRTTTTGGIVMLSFTPLQGTTKLIGDFERNARENPDLIYITRCGWDDVPHLTALKKMEMLKGISPHQIEARTKGIPSIGAGHVYQFPQSSYVVEPFDIPNQYRLFMAVDGGYNTTAALFFAYDGDTETYYVYDEYYGQRKPNIDNVNAIYARSFKGKLKGVIDPNNIEGSTSFDGRKIVEDYRNRGLNLSKANNAVEFGINKVYELFNNGQLKIFKTCKNLLDELKLYTRDLDGKIKKVNDHAVDALRYGVVSGLPVAEYKSALLNNNKRNINNLYHGRFMPL